MNKTIIASVAGALAIAALITFLPGLNAAVEASVPVAGSKSDRLDYRPIGTKCSERAWRYFEADCLRGKTMHTPPASVRVVTADRFQG